MKELKLFFLLLLTIILFVLFSFYQSNSTNPIKPSQEAKGILDEPSETPAIKIGTPECLHPNTHTTIITPTCIEDGKEIIICDECKEILNEKIIKRLGHINTHTEIKEPTCTDEGKEMLICNECGSIISETTLPVVEHIYGDWKIQQYATPIKDGSKYRECSCGHKEISTYSLNLGENYIFIEGTNLVGSLFVGDLTQNNIDVYDMVYSEELNGHAGPWILGHRTKTMKYLQNISVGDNIYVSINGTVNTYKVIISESGLQNNSWTDIICQQSGYSIFNDFEAKTLRMYTCYGEENERWVVFASLIEKAA